MIQDSASITSPSALNAASAPRWAVSQKGAMDALRCLCHWWYDRQDPDDGLGFGDDDIESVLLSAPVLALGQGDERTRAALELVADQMWYRYGYFEGEEVGYPWDPESDVEHAAEPISNSQTKMLLLDYGNPKFVERCMVSSRNVEQWTTVNEHGKRHFKSFLFGGKGVSAGRYLDVDTPVCARALIPAVFLAWYNHDPVLMKYMIEYGLTWAELGMSTEMGKPVGEFPSEVRYWDGKIGAYSGAWDKCAGCRQFERLNYNMYRYMMSMFSLTGDDRYLEPYKAMILLGTQRNRLMDWAEDAWDYRIFTGRTDLDATFAPVAEESYIWRWLLTGDKDALADGCDRMRDDILSNFNQRTVDTDFDDPNSNYETCVDETVVNLMYTGGPFHHVAAYPYVAVTWGGTDENFCGLVLEQNSTSLKVLAYSFGSEPVDVSMYVWQLAPGEYRVRRGVDIDGDDCIDEGLSETTLTLARGSSIDFRLIPGRVNVIEAACLRTIDSPVVLSDLALGRDDLLCSKASPRCGDEVELNVTIHNIGTQDASGVQVSFAEMPSGRVFATVDIGDMPAPLNMTPSRKTVSTKWTIPDGATGVRVSVAGDSEQEITLRNNSIDFALEDLRTELRVPRVEPQKVHGPLMPTQVLEASMCTTLMVVDGKLDEPVWGNAEKAGLIYRMYHPTDELANVTIARACYDEDSLYVAFECFDPEPASLRANLIERDEPLWTEESIELLIDPEHDHCNFYHFAVNPKNTQYDGDHVNPYWNGEWESAVSIGEDRWIVEIRLPAALLGVELKPGHRMGINFVRTSFPLPDRKNGQCGVWQKIPGWNTRPKYFGELILK